MTPSGNVLIDFTKWVFKWLAILLVGLLAVVFVLIGGWWTWNWWSYERHEKQIEVVAINSAARNVIVQEATSRFSWDSSTTRRERSNQSLSM